MGALGEGDQSSGSSDGDRAVGAVGEGGKSSGSSGTAAGNGLQVYGSYRDAIQEGCLHAHQRTVLNGASVYG